MKMRTLCYGVILACFVMYIGCGNSSYEYTITVVVKSTNELDSAAIFVNSKKRFALGGADPGDGKNITINGRKVDSPDANYDIAYQIKGAQMQMISVDMRRKLKSSFKGELLFELDADAGKLITVVK